MSDPASPAQEDAAGPAPWALLGRDNPAGQALYKLYNADNMHGRAAGRQYSQQNRQKIQKQLSVKAAAGIPPGPVKQEPVKPAKPKVAVPHFRRKTDDTAVDKLAHVPHRKQGQQIMAELAQEQDRAWGHVPLPSGRLIDEQEKQRCALLMQYKGKVPSYELQALNSSKNSKIAAASGTGQLGISLGGTGVSSSNSESDMLRSRRHALQPRFTEAANEVAEREDFVSSMQQLGKLRNDHLDVIKAEVAAKVREMGQLDGQIKELDRQLKAHMAKD